MSLARSVDQEMQLLSTGYQPPHVRYDTASQCIILRKADGQEKRMKALEVRKNCACALCIDEFTGNKMVKEGMIREDVFPHKIDPKGNYAVAIVWSDGHKSSIYPYDKLLSPEIKEYKKA